VPAQRRSVSSSNTTISQQRLRENDNNNNVVISPRVRFNDGYQASSSSTATTTITTTTKNINNPTSKSTEDILSEKPQMRKSYTTHETFSTQPKEKQGQQELTKSADNLLDNSSGVKTTTNKKKDLNKQTIELRTTNTSSINNLGEQQISLSKSSKDLRLFVSNSFSPSLIVRPPPPTESSSSSSSVAPLSKPILNKTKTTNLPSDYYDNNFITNYENVNINNYAKKYKEDKIKSEFLQQQKLITKLKTQSFPVSNTSNAGVQSVPQSQTTSNRQQQHVKIQDEFQLNKSKANSNYTIGSRIASSRDQRNDDDLLDCILDMKQQQQQQQQLLTNKRVIPIQTRTSIQQQQQQQPQISSRLINKQVS